MGLSDLPTVEEARALRPIKQKWEMTTRAEENADADRDDERQLAKWRARIYALDKHTCRCCGIKVKRSLKPLPDRAEANHVEGRANHALRYDVRNGICLCLRCHRRVTGMVLDKLKIAGTRFFRLNGVRYINARFPVHFRKAA